MDESFTSVHYIEFLPAQAGKHPIFRSGGVWGEPVPVHRDTVGPEGKTWCAYLRARVAPLKCSGFDALMPPPARPSRDSEDKENTASPSGVVKRPASANAQDAALQPAKKKAKMSTTAAKSQQLEPIELDSSGDEAALAKATHTNETAREAAAKTAEKRAALAVKPAIKQVASTGTAASASAAAEDSGLLPVAGRSRRAAATFRLPANTATESVSRLPDLYSMNATSMPPGSYNVHLVIDSREQPGLNNKRLTKMLTDAGVSWESRTLAMGDAIWIAKCKTSDREVVLDCCLERKRLDDLVSSIKGESEKVPDITLC